jgi:hypothetical protein
LRFLILVFAFVVVFVGFTTVFLNSGRLTGNQNRDWSACLRLLSIGSKNLLPAFGTTLLIGAACRPARPLLPLSLDSKRVGKSRQIELDADDFFREPTPGWHSFVVRPVDGDSLGFRSESASYLSN